MVDDVVESDETERLILSLETRWEDPYVDFKRQLSLSKMNEKAEFVKDILGLANTQGASRRFLPVGWDDQTRTVVPPGVSPQINQDRLQQILNTYTDPPPHLSYRTSEWHGVPVGIIEVIREPLRVPYRVSRRVGKRDVGEVFVRHGTITEAPTPRELDALAEEGLNARLREGADELISPDRASLRFTPLGLSTGSLLTPKAAATFQDRTIAVDLAASVPDPTRRLFQRLQAIHRQGIWNYGMYTVADTYALQVIEHAFAARLLDYYENRVPLLNARGVESEVSCSSFQDLLASTTTGRWRLRSLRLPGKSVPFNGTLAALFAWARHEGLLRGQRSRRFDIVLPRMLARTRPLQYSVHMPVDSSASIRQTGEFINQLWGFSTQGGEVFSSPMERRVLVLGWSRQGDAAGTFLPEQLASYPDVADWRFIVVLGVDRGGAVDDFHSDFELTPLPTSLLHGEDGLEPTLEWLSREAGQVDTVEILDRYFVINLGDRLWPRSVGQFAALHSSERTGRWLLVQADSPFDAFAHARASLQASGEHRLLGCCNACWVTAKVTGSWRHVMTAASNMGLDVTPVPTAGVEVPMRRHWLQS